MITTLNTLHPTLYTLQPTLYTLPANPAPHNLILHCARQSNILRCTHHTLHTTTCTFKPKPFTPHPTVYNIHYILHSTFYVVPSTFYTLHSTLYILHSTFYTVHSTFYTIYSTFYTLHSTFYTNHPTFMFYHGITQSSIRSVQVRRQDGANCCRTRVRCHMGINWPLYLLFIDWNNSDCLYNIHYST